MMNAPRLTEQLVCMHSLCSCITLHSAAACVLLLLCLKESKGHSYELNTIQQQHRFYTSVLDFLPSPSSAGSQNISKAELQRQKEKPFELG